MLVAYLYNGRHPWKLRMKSMYVSNWIWPEGHFIWEKERLQLHIFSPKLQERLQQLDLTERSGSTLQSRQGDQVGLPNRSQNNTCWFCAASRGPGDTQLGNGVRHFFTCLFSVEYKDIKQGLKTSEAFRDQVGNKNV